MGRLLDKWFTRKEPIAPIEAKVGDILAKVYEFNPNCKYLFWFEKTQQHEIMKIIKNSLTPILGDGDFLLIAGVQVPVIYEFEENANGEQTVTTRSIEPSLSGDRSKTNTGGSSNDAS